MIPGRTRQWTRALAIFVATLGIGGCIDTPAEPEPAPGPSVTDPGDDDRAYDAKAADLEAHRAPFSMPDMMYPYPVHNRLYWLDFASAPSLRRYNAETKAFGAYSFSLGNERTFNFEASDALIVHAEARTGVYRAYDPNDTNMLLDQISLEPEEGAAWGAYAVDGADVYIVRMHPQGTHTLYHWRPGTDPDVMTTFKGANTEISRIQALAVQGQMAILLERGGLWSLDLTTKKLTRIDVKTPVASIFFDASKFVFTTTLADAHHELSIMDRATKVQRNLSDEFEANPFRVTDSHARAHHFDSDEYFTVYGEWVVYQGFSGIFAYHLQERRIVPILLGARGDEAGRYHSPVILDNGTLFVWSRTNAYTVDLTQVLR